MKEENILISIIIRTYARPDVLRNAIESVKRQTYPNIEIYVVEDGKNTAQHMIETEYGDLNIKYHAMGEKVGRTKTGNYALRHATGEFFNFLDDDDILYPSHVEVLMKQLDSTDNLAAYSIAEEMQLGKKRKRKTVKFSQPFNRSLLYYKNYIPIQSIMFHRSLFEKLGGFDESMDVLEDWDLWVRYSTITDFSFVKEKTSLYYVSLQREKIAKRDELFHKTKKELMNKFKDYTCQVSAYDLSKDVEWIVKEYKTNRVERFLRLIRNFILYGER